MRLARNLIIGVAIALLGVLAIDGYLDVLRTYAVFESDMRADGRMLGRSLAEAISAARAGRAGALHVSDHGDRVTIQVVSLDGSPAHGQPTAPAAMILDGLRKRGALHYKQDNSRLFTYVGIDREPQLALEVSEDLAPLNAHGRTIALRAAVRTALTACAVDPTTYDKYFEKHS